jgi:hypothetical protein
LAVSLLWAGPAQAQPVLRVVRASATASNLVANPGFEVAPDGRLVGWAKFESGFVYGEKSGRNQSGGIFCENEKSTEARGAGAQVVLNQREAAPLVVRGWSKAQGVSGSSDSGYAIYVDLQYEDGTPLWGQTADFRCGTHDWEMRELTIMPEKPVRRLSVYFLLRGHAGQVWFDDLSVSEVKAAQGAFLWQGASVTPGADRSLEGTKSISATKDGLSMESVGNVVTHLKWDGQTLAQPNPAAKAASPYGFLARDVAADSDVHGFSRGQSRELGLRLESRILARSNCVEISGRVADTTGKDRAITLAFALPLDATGWRWWDDMRRSRVITGKGAYEHTVSVKCGATGGMSLYPLAAVEDGRHGLALALDMAQPGIYRLTYHAGLHQLLIAYDFGLVPETANFPSGADFRFVVYRFDPAGGFRSALEKLGQIFPAYFQVRAKEQGLWMPFTDISTVKGWQDFGFKFHEGNNNVPFDDAHGILSFRYTEPMTWWMAMGKEVERTPQAAIQIRDNLLASAKPGEKTPAEVTQAAAMFDETGQPAMQFQNTPWCNGAIWSLNPNPHLAGKNFARWHWSAAETNRLYGPQAKGTLDGEYLDSLEGYVTTDLNFRREHFVPSTVPLTFASASKRPALYKGLAVFEFTKWFSEEVHGMDKLTFANGVPYRFTFLCPWLDVLGTETDWMANRKYQPPGDATLCLWRAMAGAKPYLLLMNTRYDDFTPEWVERYFQHSLFYGFYPGMFSHNAADNPYWGNPKWYERDRALFRKYLPLIKRVGEAGWQPVTGAACDNGEIWLERFGSGVAGRFYLTAFNSSKRDQGGTVRTLNARLAQRNRELLGATAWRTGGSWAATLGPAQTAVFEVEN